MSYVRLSRYHQHHRTRIKSNTDPPIILMIHPLEQQDTYDVTYIPMTISSQYQTPIVFPLPLPLQSPLALVLPHQDEFSSTLVRSLTTSYDHDRINRRHIRSHSLPIHTMHGPTNAVLVFPHRSPTAVAMPLSHPQTLPLACTPNPRMYHLSPALRSSTSSTIAKRRTSYSNIRHHPYQPSSRTFTITSSPISSPCQSHHSHYRPLGLRLLIPHHDTDSINHTSRSTPTTSQSNHHPIPPSPQPPPFRSDTYQPPPLPFPFPLPFPSTLSVN